ncbi:MAG: N-formylglutamate deformylase/formiminoglutamase [Bacteriovoracaceae bacterium]|jgi:N-formylglutamate deformylase
MWYFLHGVLAMINIEKQSAIFNLYPAKAAFKGILSIPHSGEELPDEFKQYLSSNMKDLMQDVDFRVHELVDIEKLQENGITVLKSNIIRTAIDLNRKKEICLFSWKKNSKAVQIVNSGPPIELGEQLIEKYYSPYYEVLKTLILDLQSKMKIPSLVDLHSMPSRAEEYHLKINPTQDLVRPDFCISDISGQSCEKEYIDFISNSLNIPYSNVTQNNPYFGGNITRFLHSTYEPLNNIQIEISREIYMDERNQSLVTEKVTRLKGELTNSLIEFFNHFYDKHKS